MASEKLAGAAFVRLPAMRAIFREGGLGGNRAATVGGLVAARVSPNGGAAAMGSKPTCARPEAARPSGVPPHGAADSARVACEPTDETLDANYASGRITLADYEREVIELK